MRDDDYMTPAHRQSLSFLRPGPREGSLLRSHAVADDVMRAMAESGWCSVEAGGKQSCQEIRPDDASCWCDWCRALARYDRLTGDDHA